jgi:hypothetical protein
MKTVTVQRALLLLFCFVFVGRLLADESASFTGSWDGPNDAASAFSLDLTQTGNRIAGYHSAIALRGHRIDAVLPKEGPPSISGTVIGGVARVRFQSAYDESGKGEATLTLRKGKLEWKITKSSGIHYFPTSCILHRSRPNQTRASKRAAAELPTRNVSNCPI